jgi:diaminohydroxyphosphoribosylaminopyrimidine deaminase/5-amino-6-(5-phosphoribosylamino)uracil reductase
MTLDGKIATRTGDSKWISNEDSRARVHALRGRMDGIVVGIGTVLADDPLLTARPPGPRTATRIILDSKGRLPASCQLLQTARTIPTLVVVSEAVPAARIAELKEWGTQVLQLPGPDGRPDPLALLEELGRRRMINLLIEGGSGVLGSFLDANAIDEFHVFLAPRLVGGAQALPPFGGQGVTTMAEALTLTDCHIEVVQGDIYVHGWRG